METSKRVTRQKKSDGNEKVMKPTIVSIISLSIKNTGLWLNADRRTHGLAKVSIVCFFSTYILQVVALVTARGDPQKLFECLSVMLFCGMGILKLLSLHVNRARWCLLLFQVMTLEKTQLTTPCCSATAEYDSRNEEKVTLSARINDYTDNFRSTSTALSRIYSFTGVIYILSPFVEYFIKKLIIGSDALEYPHILPNWAPLDSFSTLAYMLIIVLEAVAAIYCVCIHIAFDLTVVGLMIFLCGQFSLLRECTERIGGRWNTLMVTKEGDEKAHLRIVKCHQIHLLLVKSLSEVDSLIKNILGIYFYVVTLTLCSVAVRLKSESMSTMQLVSLLQYMCATLTQLFLFCRYGDAVWNKNSIKMGEGPFGAATWSMSPRIRNELLILSIGMMRPRKMNAGPFRSLDLPSFIQIVRAAYSYYAVLANKSE